MKLLLDTHTIIWFLNGDKNISQKVKFYIESIENTKYVSIASLWEIAIKYNLGKFQFTDGIDTFFDLVLNNGFKILPININHLIELSTLEKYHKDPFDRILIAQAISENMAICTIDDKIKTYRVDVIW